MESGQDGRGPNGLPPAPSVADAPPARPSTSEATPEEGQSSPAPSPLETAPPATTSDAESAEVPEGHPAQVGNADAAGPSVDASPSPRPPAARRAALRQHTLRDRIVEHLRATQADSISGIARVLAASGDAPVHRLTIAGYLQAMTETGVLRELDRPPSKLYQLQNPESHWSLHQRVHRALQETPMGDAERCRLALAVLQRLLQRPIFLAELQHAGFQGIPPEVERTVVGEPRRQFRELFARRATPRIDIPRRNPLLSLPEGDPLLASAAVDEAIHKVLLRATSAEHLVAPRPPGPQQAQLELGGAS